MSIFAQKVRKLNFKFGFARIHVELWFNRINVVVIALNMDFHEEIPSSGHRQNI